MTDIRKDLEEKIKRSDNLYSNFVDLRAIDRTLDGSVSTAELFIWLHNNNNEDARKIINLASESLAKSGKYEILAKYISGLDDYIKQRNGFRDRKKYYTDKSFKNVEAQANENYFTNKVVVIIKTLANSGNHELAKEIAEMAENELEYDKYKQLITNSLKANPNLK